MKINVFELHGTKEEAENYAATMLDVYADFAEKVMAIPVVKGVEAGAPNSMLPRTTKL